MQIAGRHAIPNDLRERRSNNSRSLNERFR